MYTDTHTHLYLSDYENGGHDAVRRAIEAGVTKMVLPNVNLDTIAPMEALVRAFSDNLSMAIGIHPTDLPDDVDYAMKIIEEKAKSGAYCAVGEIGIDLYWDKTNLDKQMQAFARQLDIATAHSLPVIIHCREALDPTLEVLGGYKQLQAVMHSFTGNEADIEKTRKVQPEIYFGINGIVTFKNSTLKNVLPNIGLDKMLLETDAPYLAPVPYRGKRNESSYIPIIASTIAQHLGVAPSEVARATTLNASTLLPNRL